MKVVRKQNSNLGTVKTNLNNLADTFSPVHISGTVNENCLSGLFNIYDAGRYVQIISECNITTITKKVVKNGEVWIPFANISGKNIFNLATSNLTNPVGCLCAVYPSALTINGTFNQQTIALSCYAYYDGNDTVFYTHISEALLDKYTITGLYFSATVIKLK